MEQDLKLNRVGFQGFGHSTTLEETVSWMAFEPDDNIHLSTFRILPLTAAIGFYKVEHNPNPRIMKTNSNPLPVRSLLLLAGGVVALHLSIGNVAGTTLFSENFDGYTSFPSQVPSGDYVNLGIPQISEGASEIWYGARFEDPDGGTIDQDLFVQKFGDYSGFNPPSNPSGNATPVARFEDDAGLVLCIDTTGFTGVSLAFDWRTFQASTSDRVVVGYFVGELGFDTGANRFKDLRTGSGAWANWTELMRDGPRGSPFEHEVFALPGADDAGPVYVAFWLDNGEADYGKLDNVVITATPIMVPEPTSMSLALFGLLVLAAGRKFRQ